MFCNIELTDCIKLPHRNSYYFDILDSMLLFWHIKPNFLVQFHIDLNEVKPGKHFILCLCTRTALQYVHAFLFVQLVCQVKMPSCQSVYRHFLSKDCRARALLQETSDMAEHAGRKSDWSGWWKHSLPLSLIFPQITFECLEIPL